MRIFDIGQQPCQKFTPQMVHIGDGLHVNIHECFCGYSVGKRCEKTVSFCLNCCRDHHEDGYENCQCGGKGFE